MCFVAHRVYILTSTQPEIQIFNSGHSLLFQKVTMQKTESQYYFSFVGLSAIKPAAGRVSL